MMAVEQIQKIGRLTAERQPFVVATVVRARRPTSVHPGDGAIVLRDGTIEGFVGGVCAESSVRLHALRALETGEPLLLRLVPGDDTIPPTHADDLVDDAVVERNPCLSGGSLEIFLEPHVPASRLVVVGTSPIARALGQLAAAADYDCRFGDGADVGALEGAAAVVVASHGSGEEGVLAHALEVGVPYVALVASPKRGRTVRAELAVAPELAAQLHTPAGIDIGARTPGEIAISILAEMVAGHHARPGSAGADWAGAGSAGADSAGARGRSTTPEVEVLTPPVTGVAVDPVCGMKVATVDTTPHLVLDGETAWFCGAGCRASYARAHALG